MNYFVWPCRLALYFAIENFVLSKFILMSAMLAVTAGVAQAQDYPTRPVRVMGHAASVENDPKAAEAAKVNDQLSALRKVK